MRLISWNVNGLRASLGKGFNEAFLALDADFFCLQETKIQPGQVDFSPAGYAQLWHYAEKKGYSGTAIFAKEKPLSVQFGPGLHMEDHEGRLITAEFQGFYLLCCYTPNAQPELKRLGFRLEWEAALQKHIADLQARKPVLLCGDLNVAHQEIDLTHPKANRGNPGFSDEERAAFTGLLKEQTLVDSYRHFYPDRSGAYSWWSYRMNAREKNVGWRIDYFLCSEALRGSLRDALIYPQIFGSDHCPVGLELSL
ncbi:MAG: exodeoxyribonuclease III [Christensenellaceae bacterium]|jgi:exodeoxyribonuclease-3|nr:exodeoxyribonuclease III [Christensenellaceae bacterium]